MRWSARRGYRRILCAEVNGRETDSKGSCNGFFGVSKFRVLCRFLEVQCSYLGIGSSKQLFDQRLGDD